MTDWNIQSRAHECQACNRRFADKEVYHTVLFDDRAELRRMDICQGCWEKEYGEGQRDKKGFISYWHGVYAAPPPPTDAIKKETAETLLRKLIELNDPKYVPVAYILAVMLERKKMLKVKEQIKKEDRRIFVYEQPSTGDVFTIADPNLQLNQLEVVQRDVAHLLEHGFATPLEEAAGVAPERQAPGPDSAEAAATDPIAGQDS
jgi:hypothetical protein